MTARVQAGAALLLAVALHVGAFAMAPEPAGAVASGASGADLVSLEAVDASMADLVQAWDRPPAVADATPPQQPISNKADTPPDLAPPSDAAPQTQAASMPALTLSDDIAPRAEVSLPTPATKPKPRPKPKAAPEQASVNANPAPKPAKPPKPSAPGQAAQKATGSGGGAMAGVGGTARAATLSKAAANNLKSSWGAAIRARVEKRKRHPGTARGASGTVTVRLTVTRAGALAAVSVARSSGHAALDNAAVKAVQSAAGFPAAPKGLNDASYTFTLPMAFGR